METAIPKETIESCRAHGITLDPEARFLFRKTTHTFLERPASLRKGTYGIDFVGAFTFLGGRETLMTHIASIGRFCSIASNIISGQPEHPTNFLSSAPLFTGSPFGDEAAEFQAANREMVDKAARSLARSMENRIEKITIGNDVWIGEGVFIRAGVTIGDGAVVGARAVGTHDVPPYAIVVGTPARVIRYRFEPEIIAALLELGWWKYGLTAIQGADFTDIGSAISTIAGNIESGRAQPYEGTLVAIDEALGVTPCRYDAQSGQLHPVHG